MTESLVAVQRVLPVDAQALFDVLADPAQHPRIDGSGSVRAPLPGNPVRLERGAEFSMSMRIVGPYRITNRVVEFEEGRRIAWRHFGGHRWRYLLTPVEGGTLVQEEWDATRLPYPVRLGFDLARLPQRHRVAMERTLVRLGEVAADLEGRERPGG